MTCFIYFTLYLSLCERHVNLLQVSVTRLDCP